MNGYLFKDGFSQDLPSKPEVVSVFLRIRIPGLWVLEIGKVFFAFHNSEESCGFAEKSFCELSNPLSKKPSSILSLFAYVEYL